MRYSHENRYRGKVASVLEGAVCDIVTVDLGSAGSLEACSTRMATNELGLVVGRDVKILVSPFKAVLSNELPSVAACHLFGTVASIELGAVLARVALRCNGVSVVSICLIEHVSRLFIHEGSQCYVLIEPVDVIIEV